MKALQILTCIISNDNQHLSPAGTDQLVIFSNYDGSIRFWIIEIDAYPIYNQHQYMHIAF